jgi:hypothetical protein
VSNKRTILIMFFCLSLGIFIGISIKTITGSRESTITNSPYEKLPRQLLVVTIEISQQEELFSQLRKFSDKQGFAIRIAPTTPSGKDFIVEMWREDVKIIGLNSFEPGIFNFGFFDTDGTYPYPLPVIALNSLVNDFKLFVYEIDDVKISDE